MVYINEFLPNPIGVDGPSEFIELYNGGAGAVDLAGWKIGTGTASTTPVTPAKTPKPFALAGRTIAAHGYLVLTHAADGLTLKNTDGALLLYGPDGKVADLAAFNGAAPEGKSYSRISYDAGPGQHFIFTDPTPGAANAAFDNIIAVAHYRAGAPLDPVPFTASPAGIALYAIGLGALLALLFIYAVKKNENLSHYLFGGNEAPRRGIFETIRG